MTRTKSTIGISAVVFFAAALLGVACSSEPPVSGSGGAAGAAGAAGHGTAGTAGAATAGTAGTAGAATAGTGGSGGAGGAVNNCTPLPANLLLTDFSPATFKGTDGSSWKAGKTDLWGSATSLTGGDIFYQGKAGSAPKVTLHGETLTVSATIEAGDYAGYMFNFGPKCTNASATQGLQFDILGDSTLGDATLKVQMQQKSDYPSTANPSSRPGDCVPDSMATQYNDCLSPAVTVASSGSSLTTGLTQLPWLNFGGGKPAYAVDAGQLMAIQWQFECPPGGGTVAASGGSGGGGESSGGGSSGAAGTGGSSGGSSAGSDSGGVSSGGAAGSSGAASAGTSGESGSGGTAGSSGTSGSGGTSGSNAAAGAGGSTAGSGGTAGSSGAASGGAGSGGTGSTTPPCVVSFTIDNVKFY